MNSIFVVVAAAVLAMIAVFSTGLFLGWETADSTDPETTFAITMEKKPCLGTCPVYTVTIDEKGIISYDGIRFVNKKGDKTSKISKSKVESIVEFAEENGFFSYEMPRRGITIAEHQITTISIAKEGKSQTIINLHYGDEPEWIQLLENGIESTDPIKSWVRGQDITDCLIDAKNVGLQGELCRK